MSCNNCLPQNLPSIALIKGMHLVTSKPSKFIKVTTCITPKLTNFDNHKIRKKCKQKYLVHIHVCINKHSFNPSLSLANLTGRRTGMCPLVKKGSSSISMAVGRLDGLGRRSFVIRVLASRLM